MRTLFERRLEGARHVLLAGCGGGFDVASAIPLHQWLTGRGVAVTLANLSFSQPGISGAKPIGPAGWIVDPTCRDMAYFPERWIADWLLSRGHDARVIAYRPTGVRPLRDTFAAIIEKEAIDTVVLVDGGTDSVARGDEARLGTIEEDALSVVALSLVPDVSKLLVCVGFGIDAYHGICHHSFLENTAQTVRAGGFLGCLSLAAGTPEGDAFLDLADYLNRRQPKTRSIVVNSIASALRGEFGDFHATERTGGSELFINPLMSLCWCYDAVAIAAMMRFAGRLASTATYAEVVAIIARAHASSDPRPFKPLPL